MSQGEQRHIQVRGAIAPDIYDPDAFDPVEREAEGMTLQEYLAVLLRRRWLMLGVMGLVLIAGIVYTLTRRPVYEASAKVVVVSNRINMPTSENEIPIVSDVQALTRSRSVDTQVEIISSPDNLEQAFASLSPDLRKAGFERDSLPPWACKVSVRKNTDVIIVTGRAYSPAAAAALANTVADTYFKRDLAQNNQATRQAREYTEEKMAIVEKDLARANAALSSFKQRTGFFAPGDQLSGAADQLAKLSLDMDAAKAEAASSRQEVVALRKKLDAEQPDVVSNVTLTRNPQVTDILQKIDSLNSERIALLQEYTPESREVKKVEASIALEKQRLSQLTETIVGSKMRIRNPVRDELLTRYATSVASVASAEARASALGAEIETRQRAARELPEHEREFTELAQQAALLQRSYEMLSSKYYTLLLSEQATLPNGMLVSAARTPKKPAYPSRKSNAVLFLLLGTLLAVAAALVAERLDSRVHDHPAVERMSRLATLSAVPRIWGESPQLLSGMERSNGALLESFRILRNNISLSGIDRTLRTIAITSPGRGEGKSTTSINLAVTMALEGRRVLLVDADMRRPSLHRYLDLLNEVGLSSVITGACTIDDAVVPTRTENVSFMSSGPIPPNPAEILNSKPGRELFRTLTGQYDVVLVDCPPATGSSDIQVISTLVDGVLLVVSMNQTLKPHLSYALRVLSQVSAPLIGLVLNRMDTRHPGYGYYGYCYSYTNEENTAGVPGPQDE